MIGSRLLLALPAGLLGTLPPSLRVDVVTAALRTRVTRGGLAYYHHAPPPGAER